jgi:hypothetical protein
VKASHLRPLDKGEKLACGAGGPRSTWNRWDESRYDGTQYAPGFNVGTIPLATFFRMGWRGEKDSNDQINKSGGNDVPDLQLTTTTEPLKVGALLKTRL